MATATGNAGTQGEPEIPPSVNYPEEGQEEEDQDPPQIDWDWTCGVALPHFTFITQYMLPLRHVGRQVNERVKRQLQELVEIPQGTSLQFVGSIAGGIELPKVVNKPFDDISLRTILIIPDEFIIFEESGESGSSTILLADYEGKTPGFLRLKLRGDEETKFIKEDRGSRFLSAVLASNHYKNAMPTSDDTATKKRLNNATVAIHSPQWPKSVAKEWTDRNRPSQWLPSEAIESITAGGCHAIPGHHADDKDVELGWEWDFSVAEKQLALRLTDIQRQCFLFFKMVYYTALDYPYFITEDHLKWIFYMVCDRIPQSEWNEQEMPAIMLCLVDEVLHAIINGELPHYFIAKRNTIDHIPEDFIFDLMERVSKARQAALQNIFKFNKFYKFSFWPKKRTFEDIFKPLMSDMDEQHDDVLKSYTSFKHSAAELATCHIKEDNYDEARLVCEDVIQMLKTQFGEDVQMTVVGLLEEIAYQLKDLDLIINVYEYIIQKYPGHDSMHSLKGNLACFYTNKYHMVTDPTEKADTLNKTEALFQDALSHEKASGATYTDYSNFLCSVNRHSDAIPYLLHVIENEKLSPTSGNVYGHEEENTVDENLKKEIEIYGSISLISVIYSMYMLVNAYIKTHQHDAAKDIMPGFAMVTKAIRKDPAAVCWEMMGYAYQNLEMYKEAVAAFDKAHELKPTYHLAQENSELCKALMLSKEMTIPESVP